ncbi:MAG TPA: hypothetical protein VGM90_08850 [Kofleriaceae bacterium]
MKITLRKFAPLLLATTVLGACGDDNGAGPDGGGTPTPPRVIAGGGIGDGPIAGVVNVYVIDDLTRAPVEGAQVRVGEVEGSTDATGLFVATGVTGPQTVLVKADSYRSEMWIGANGANLTFDLNDGAAAAPTTATVKGALSLASFPALATNHVYFASVAYSQDDRATDELNNLVTTNNTQQCLFTAANLATACQYTVTTRVGKLALFSPIYDVDTKGTAVLTDDANTIVGWAFHTGLTTTANGTLTDIAMQLVPTNMTEAVSVDFGTPPGTLSMRGAAIGLDTDTDGTMQMVFIAPTANATYVPKVDAIPGSTTRRLTAVASDGATAPLQSIVLRRGLTGTQLAAGTWLAPIANTTATRTTAAWSPVTGATVHGIEYTQGTAHLLNISVLDATASVTIPDFVSLPAGALTAKIQAIGAPGLDVNDFALDTDRTKLAEVTAKTIQLD